MFEFTSPWLWSQSLRGLCGIYFKIEMNNLCNVDCKQTLNLITNEQKIKGPWRKLWIAYILVFQCSLSLSLGIKFGSPVKGSAVYLFISSNYLAFLIALEWFRVKWARPSVQSQLAPARWRWWMDLSDRGKCIQIHCLGHADLCSVLGESSGPQWRGLCSRASWSHGPFWRRP